MGFPSWVPPTQSDHKIIAWSYRSVWHGFTKMTVSPLIMVRFEKFEIWHTQGFDADLYDVTIMSRATCATTSHAHEDVTIDAIMATISFYCVFAMGCCHGPISLTFWWILLILGRQTGLAKKTIHTKNCHHSPHIKGTGGFLLNTMTTVWLPWKPIA